MYVRTYQHILHIPCPTHYMLIPILILSLHIYI
jgi:hypothetical protein